VAGSCEHDDEPSCSMKGGELLDCLSDCQFLKKRSVPYSEFDVLSSSTSFLDRYGVPFPPGFRVLECKNCL
jgi:hypothetical protein